MSDELLKEQKTADGGNGLFATRHIPQYSLIYREPATLGAVEEDCLADVCSYCFLANQKFPTKKCAGCMNVTYCSEKCQRKDWSIHKQECVFINMLGSPGVPMMRLLLRCLVKAKQEPLFLESLNGLVSNEENIPSDQKNLFIATHMMVSFHLAFAVPENITADEVIRIGCILKSNSFTALTDNGPPKSMMFCSRTPLINHSCDPNAEFVFDGRVMRVTSLRNIAEGEEVTIG